MKIATMLVFFLLASSTTVVPLAYGQDAWGVQPDQEAAQAAAIEAMQTQLKDPYSAQYRWTPISGTSVWPDRRNDGTCRGWILKGAVNAKNSYGGYIGEREYSFYFMDQKLVCIVGQRLAGRYRDVLVEERIL